MNYRTIVPREGYGQEIDYGLTELIFGPEVAEFSVLSLILTSAAYFLPITRFLGTDVAE
jgi:hypothetical protein